MVNAFPIQSAPFIGRGEDLANVQRLLADSSCRLLTVTGLGGCGKTRLAIEIAHKVAEHFQHGIIFVALQALTKSDLLVSTIGQAAGLTFYSGDKPEVQLFNFLREKSLLLILDNFEHLLSGAALVSAILTHASEIKILVTSRETLNIREEWLYPLSGMAIPPSVYSVSLEDYESVQLFLYHARRVQPRFNLSDERKAIIQICKMSEGIPLAIELAASWLKSLSPAQIALEMQHNLDFLSTRAINVEERHRSIRAVFDQSWKLLLEGERIILAKLSVFRGGFDREAAETVAGATLSTLTILVEKSLLQMEASSRYTIHEMLRQYAETVLESDDELAKHTRKAYLDYYTMYIIKCEQNVSLKADPQSILLRFEHDIQNIHMAWSWALTIHDHHAIDLMLNPLCSLLELRSRFQEGEKIFNSAADAVLEDKGENLLYSRLLLCQGTLCISSGDYHKAHSLCQKALIIVQQFDEQTEIAYALCNLGLANSYLGEYTESEQISLEGLALYRALNNAQGEGRCLFNLAYTSGRLGDFKRAKQLYQESIVLLKGSGNRRWLAEALINLGLTTYTLGDYLEAKSILEESLQEVEHIHYQRGIAKALDHLGVVHFWGFEGYEDSKRLYEQSLEIRREIGDQPGIALSLNNLGDLASRLEKYDEAKTYYEECLQIKRKIGDHWGLALALGGLVDVTCALGDYAVALQYARESLRIALELGATALVLALSVSAAVLFQMMGTLVESAVLFELVIHHPATASETKKVAQQRYLALAVDLPASTHQYYVTSNLHKVTEALNLESHAFADYISALPINDTISFLSEPLTPRELEILQLMSTGLTNPQIAERLVIGSGTVKTHTLNIYRKLDVANRTQAIVRAQELGLLPT